MHIAVVGLSHKTAAVHIREKLSIPEPQIEAAIRHLKSYPHIEEVAILSTCNRLEIYFVSSKIEPGVWEVIQFLSEHSHIPMYKLRPHLFTLLHQDAVMHVMRVAAGLDSLVLGEGQILAQVKQMHQLAQQYQGVGRLLNRLLKQAITAGKRVRTETNIGTGAVSISSAAVELAQMKVLERSQHSTASSQLADYRITILGAGKMSRLLVQHLISKGSKDVTVLNRTLPRAEKLVKQFQGDIDLKVGLLGDLMPTIAASDLVFTGTSATEPLLDRSKLEPVLKPQQSLMIIDIAVPLNVNPDVNDLPSVQGFNVDDLKAVVAQNQESRRQMAQEAEAFLEEEVDGFATWVDSLETVPTINSLRVKIETIREQELEKALSRLGSEFGDKHKDTIEAMTRGIVNKILHDPMVQLRAQQDIEARRHAMETLRTLFNLEIEEQYSA
ncbi:glutamyl-tRNA reductase [Prochlorothrix hollandica]|uniref:Glutamyl-tRNA reductase n=1 Tax=Prochlorothrix hollandica PCC 9006 = CALU 1027 TaxID=317619 RepID=A0A0M2PY79_PROHO|nr:glutamyl-tRNA reductase [Prochlorothrix hollandica]KKI99326.1 glutamyl-tRNA reductase [Prochlorothrix hollandica PCC 9006 = CALU 1027]